jgi:hypothetical protein
MEGAPFTDYYTSPEVRTPLWLRSGHKGFALHGPFERLRHRCVEVGDEILDPLLKMFLRREISPAQKLSDQD